MTFVIPLPRPWTVLLLAGVACGSNESGPDATPAREARAQSAEPATGQAAAARPPRGRAWVILGTDTVVAEVARTGAERQRGLMFREEVPEGTGMLFVFESEAPRGFWMSNTYVPLDIAYIDSALRIVDIQQMEPEVTDTYDSARPAMFALEVPQGWFAAHGVDVGDEVEVVFGVP